MSKILLTLLILTSIAHAQVQCVNVFDSHAPNLGSIGPEIYEPDALNHSVRLGLGVTAEDFLDIFIQNGNSRKGLQNAWPKTSMWGMIWTTFRTRWFAA